MFYPIIHTTILVFTKPQSVICRRAIMQNFYDSISILVPCIIITIILAELVILYYNVMIFFSKY